MKAEFVGRLLERTCYIVESKFIYFVKDGGTMLTLESFGQRIRSLRMEKNMTQQELADKMFVSRKTIGNWESGNRLPDISLLSRLASHLGLQTYELLDEMYGSDDSPIIIVVEKESEILNSFVQMIGDTLPNAQVFGFDVFSEAQRFVAGNRVAIAFIDTELHEDSGFVLARLLQSISPRINIIFMTRNFSNADAAWEIHPSGCLLMPLTEESIRREAENLRFPVRNLL